MRRRGDTLAIGAPALRQTDDGLWRVSADVGAETVFFESATPLVPAAEAFLGAFLFPAMARGQALMTPAPVCPEWRQNVTHAAALAKDWWGLGDAPITDGGDKTPARAEGTASFFTGGVDSFFTLLTAADRIRDIVYVDGFDVALGDAARLRAVAEGNADIAEALGKRLVTVRSNLREAAAFHRLSWNVTHGAALAAAAHLLGGQAAEFLVASGFPEWVHYPHGSHPELDPAWSSSTVRLVHHGATHERLDKVAAIAASPLVQRHLRVCWQNKAGSGNCGVCEKCVRTQLQLLVAGGLDAVATFPAGPLASRIAQVPGVPQDLIRHYHTALEAIDDDDVRQAVAALLRRSPRWQRRQRLKQRLVRIHQALRP